MPGLFGKPATLPGPDEALAGHDTPMPVAERHYVLGTPLAPPYPEHTEQAIFGMGCFWGAERLFWQLEGVYTTAVGYAGGHTPNPSYEDVCSGLTGHAEVVHVVYEPARLDYRQLLRLFFESHDPTQGMRQGNDIGTQYRSAIYTYGQDQHRIAEATAAHYGDALSEKGLGPLTTEIAPAPPFYFAEDYHQQFLAKHPEGYCGLRGTGVSCPVG